MKKIAIIGYGRFGELLCNLLAPNYEIAVVENDMHRQSLATSKSYKITTMSDISDFDIIIFAVPISSFEKVIMESAKYIEDDQIVMDVCSVKVHPSNVMLKYLPNAKLIATHPMFGPDSASGGISGLQVAICPLSVDNAITNEVCALWENLGASTIITDPKSHDKDTILSQAFTYSLLKVVLGMDLSEVKLTTKKFNELTNLAEISANDSNQLFHDMLFYNPYFPSMKKELFNSIDGLKDRLNQVEQEQIQNQ